MDTFIKDITKIRKELGWSQQKLADKMFISQHAISQYENGKRNLSTEMFLYILSVMGVNIQYQLTNEKGEKLKMNKKNRKVPTEAIDFRAIRTEEGFRLWALQNDTETILVDINEVHFVVYKRGRDGALFWLDLDSFDEDKLIDICKEEDISYEQL